MGKTAEKHLNLCYSFFKIQEMGKNQAANVSWDTQWRVLVSAKCYAAGSNPWEMEIVSMKPGVREMEWNDMENSLFGIYIVILKTQKNPNQRILSVDVFSQLAENKSDK